MALGHWVRFHFGAKIDFFYYSDPENRLILEKNARFFSSNPNEYISGISDFEGLQKKIFLTIFYAKNVRCHFGEILGIKIQNRTFWAILRRFPVCKVVVWVIGIVPGGFKSLQPFPGD